MTKNRLVISSWQQAGARLGLTYAAGSRRSQEGLTLSGEIDGFATTVIQRLYRSTDQILYSGTSTMFKIELDRLGMDPEFELRPSRGLMRYLSIFARHDVPAGEREWACQFVVNGTNPEMAHRFLTKQRQAALVSAHTHRFKWVLLGSDLMHSVGHLVVEEKLIVARVQRLITIASAIRNPAERPQGHQNDWSSRPTGQPMRMVPTAVRVSRLGRWRTRGHAAEPEKRAVVVEARR